MGAKFYLKARDLPVHSDGSQWGWFETVQKMTDPLQSPRLACRFNGFRSEKPARCGSTINLVTKSVDFYLALCDGLRG